MSFRKLLAPLLAIAAMASAMPAAAANHALILWIGEYADPNASLPGIDRDARFARQMAGAFGVPQQNILEFRERQLTLQGFREAFKQTLAKVKAGDNVFIYYSGHGFQKRRPGGPGCMEGILTYDMRELEDTEITGFVVALSENAGRIVMLNDSCFSGGHFDPHGGSRSAATSKAKTWPLRARPVPCGEPVNVKLARAVTAGKSRGANITYIAAAAHNEVAFADDVGSAATLSWAQCLTQGPKPANGKDMAACAQGHLRRMQKEQTITLIGLDSAPIALGRPQEVASIAPPIKPGAPPGQGGPNAMVDAPEQKPRPPGGSPRPPGGPVNAMSALQDMKALGAQNLRVDLKLRAASVKIGAEMPSFEVSVSQPGYLYVLHVGTAGEAVNLLFPNRLDTDNKVVKGTLTLPRSGWKIRAGGPAGNNHVMAILSEKPRDFLRVMQEVPGTPFSAAPAGEQATRSLVVEATGAETEGPGRYGASRIQVVREIP